MYHIYIYGCFMFLVVALLVLDVLSTVSGSSLRTVPSADTNVIVRLIESPGSSFYSDNFKTERAHKPHQKNRRLMGCYDIYFGGVGADTIQ